MDHEKLIILAKEQHDKGYSTKEEWIAVQRFILNDWFGTPELAKVATSILSGRPIEDAHNEMIEVERLSKFGIKGLVKNYFKDKNINYLDMTDDEHGQPVKKGDTND